MNDFLKEGGMCVYLSEIVVVFFMFYFILVGEKWSIFLEKRLVVDGYYGFIFEEIYFWVDLCFR